LIGLVLVAIAALIALALWFRHAAKRRQPGAARVRDQKRPSDTYRCVELRYRSDGCDAVKRIAERRFLPGEAPEIPVPGCDAAKCYCRYVRHEDRRDSERRSPAAPVPAGGERRTKRDRRKPAKPPLRRKTRR
jgi:hypothetical protein